MRYSFALLAAVAAAAPQVQPISQISDGQIQAPATSVLASVVPSVVPSVPAAVSSVLASVIPAVSSAIGTFDSHKPHSSQDAILT